MIEASKVLGFDDRLLRMYMYEKEVIEKEYYALYGKSSMFKDVAKKAVLSKEREHVRNIMTDFYSRTA